MHLSAFILTEDRTSREARLSFTTDPELCFVLQVRQEESPLCHHGCADWIQLRADFLNQLGDVYCVICHRGHGPNLQLCGGLHTR